MLTQTKPESWFHSQEFEAECRTRRAQQRSWFRRKAKETVSETVADPDDFQPSVVAARNRYFDRANDKKRKPGGDPRQALPVGSDLQAFADTFGAEPKRFAQAEEMKRRGLHIKAKRHVLCGRIGRRLDCTASHRHKFFQPYLCRCRYCETCGPAWFRKKFSDTLAMLCPIIEHLLHDGQRRGRQMVIAKLDFTVPKTGAMPTPEFCEEIPRGYSPLLASGGAAFWYLPQRVRARGVR